ncbi:YbhN family protein [Microlunatus panaciterrae]|uniref:Uncharacterized protein (TIRG00374 family) n=1 Tax=Microlunatus panaciterrae TaxID=400768 RepID=A0ABS2RFA9_9ACTN|nr:uncharacterized protein (TIRG00374 family) [Microlunatus panaciterrae]
MPWWVKGVLSLVVLALSIWFVLVPQLPGGERALASLRMVSLPLILVATALEAASLVAYSALTACLLGRGRPRYPILLGVDLTALGLSHVLPAGGATAAAMRVRLLTLTGTRAGDALTAAAMEATGVNLMLGVIFGIGVAVSLTSVGDNPYYRSAAIGVLVLLVLAALGIWVLTRHTGRAVELSAVIGRRLPFLTAKGAQSFTRGAARRVRDMLTDPRRLTVALLLAAANWLLDASALWIMLAAFGQLVPIGPLLTVYGVGNILAVMPLTPGGIGVVEAVMVSGLVGFGIPQPAAVLGVVGWRVLEFWLPIPAAAAAYLSLRFGALRRTGHLEIRER